ncbi:MAG: hypothetical protein ABIH26_12770 [Candidatus Eisenbacteria bacterium]
MAIKLKEETILDQWTSLIENAAGHGNEVLEDVQRRLEESKIPGDCTWSVEEVKSSTWVARVRREFLIVRLDEFKDYRIYVAARDYGIHLDVARFTTVEPGFFKKALSSKLTGEADAMSAPKNILVEQDLRAWVTVVHYATLHAVESLMTKLGQDPKKIRRESKGFLEVW